MEASARQIDASTDLQSSLQLPEEAVMHDRQQAEPSTSHHAAWSAASSAPRRRNRPADATARQQRRRLRQTYAKYSNLPTELQDNEFITTGYRTELGVWDSLKSMFGLHNETGNIWTHLIGTLQCVTSDSSGCIAAFRYRVLVVSSCSYCLCLAGFVLFLVLTLVTVFAKPVPLASVSPQLTQVENHLYEFAQSNWIGAKSAWSNVRRLERQMTDYGHTNLLPFIGDMRAAEARLVHYGSSGYRGLELRVLRASAKLMDITWPVKRWPVYVFTAGAMLCLLTSTVCHVFGCCKRHVSQFIWRFDYVGIALLIVCSFYPPVYYGTCSFTCYVLLAEMSEWSSAY